MWMWLQRLIERLQPDNREASGRRPHVSLTSARSLKARAKNIYPRERQRQEESVRERTPARGRFRFPVIPDQPKQKAERPEQLPHTPFEIYKQTQEQAEQSVAPQPPALFSQTVQPKPRAAESRRKDGESDKRSFRPTEIVSPIYGRIDPNGTARDRVSAKTAADAGTSRREAERMSRTEVEPSGAPVAKQAALAETRAVTVETWAVTAETQADLTETQVAAVETPTVVVETPTATTETQAVTVETQADEAVSLTAPAAPSQTVCEPEPQTVFGPEPQLDTSAVFQAPKLSAQSGRSLEVSGEPLVGGHPSYETSETSPQADALAMSFPQPERPGMNVEADCEQERHFPAEPASREEPRKPMESMEPRYQFPPLSLLDEAPPMADDSTAHTLEQKRLLEETLANFNVSAQVVGIVKGPTVTRFELQPAPGVKVNKITSLSDDIKLNLAAKDIRIEAPIPGRNAVGIEVPNLKSEPILIRRILGSDKFRNHPSPLAVALGMDIGGEPIVADIKKMPHGLIAGATGSGKSVCINSIIVSLLYKATPEQVRLLLIDPKMVELAPYNHLPHLVTPVVTDAKQATAALKWAVEEMERRYALFVDAGVRDIDRYNKTTGETLPYIVIVIDELADLMMVSPQDVEDCIIRIAQKARACGIHLLLATQRPSVDVITGNIKANVPTRLAFAVFSQIDSRTILDQSGAERLLGRGDMLFLESGAAPIRLQGNYVSDEEIERVTEMVKRQRQPEYVFSKEELEQSVQSYDMGDDPLYHEALVYVAEQGQASASALQRRFRIGYNRAARLIEMMEAVGHVAGQSGGKPRAVLITPEDARALAEGSSLL